MRTSEKRARLRSAIIEACKARGDSREHQQACIAECLAMPEGEWQWWTEYFGGERDRFAKAITPHGPTAKPADSADETCRQTMLIDAARAAAQVGE